MASQNLKIILYVLVCAISYVRSLEMLPYSLPSRLYPAKNYVTVSGTESGGIMAQILHFTHSSHVKGCAIYSSTFYRCGFANGDLDDFKSRCTIIYGPPDPQYSVDNAVMDLDSYSSNHLIDNLFNLRYSYVYVYAGMQNVKVTTDQQLLPIALYEHYLGSAYLIKARVQDTAEELRVINTQEGYYSTCPNLQEADGTVSVNCTNLSAPAEALDFLLAKYMGYFTNPYYPQIRYVHLEPLRTFKQTEFIEGLDDTGLDDIGYYYVPRQCQSGYNSRGKCLLHIYFHGCSQGREFQGTTHVQSSNYLQIAEMNKIIMLFPQALSSSSNPEGCWDICGFSGPLYATKTGSQLEAIWRMVERVLYLPQENPQPYSPQPYSSAPSSFYRAGGGEKQTTVANKDKLRPGIVKSDKNLRDSTKKIVEHQKLRQSARKASEKRQEGAKKTDEQRREETKKGQVKRDDTKTQGRMPLPHQQDSPTGRNYVSSVFNSYVQPIYKLNNVVDKPMSETKTKRYSPTTSQFSPTCDKPKCFW